MGKVERLTEKHRLEGEKTVAFFSELKPENWDQILYSDGDDWQVRDVLAHIVDTESAQLLLVKHIVGGGQSVSKSFDINEFNANGVAKLKSRNPQELIEDFSIHRRKMVAFISSLSEADLEMVGRDTFMGEVALFERMRMAYIHVNLHIRDIRKVLG